MAPRRLPSFFKILLDRSAPNLELPPGFVRKHLENKIPENPILQSRNGGYSWRLKIKKYGEIYCFADGWGNVVEDSELGFGDFLVFWLVDESTFKLSIFSPNGCEKNFPLKIQDEHDDIDEEEAEKEEDEEEESDEEEEGEDDDNYDDGGGGGGCGDEVEYDGDEDDDGGGYDDGGGGGDIDGDDGDPFFMKIISKDQKFALRFPSEFTRLAGIDGGRTINMKNLDGKEWPMKLLSEGRNYTRYYLSTGWSEFRRVNELCEGDTCVFKFIRSEDKLCLAKVAKKRVPAKQPAGRAPAAEVLKRRSRRLPPRVVVEKVRAKQPAGKVPVAEELKRKRGAAEACGGGK